MGVYSHLNYQTKEQKLKKYVSIISTTLYFLFRIWEFFVSFKNENYPVNDKRVIFALWHHDQLCLDGMPNRDKLNILISKSIDGEIIARVVERMGFKTVRGSQNKWWKDKGGKEATFELISRLNNGENIAVTVDGPSGPLHQVKNGVIKIAKLTGAPIIPVVWYSKSRFLSSLPTWDKLKIPLWFVKTINIYGTPIYVPETANKKTEKQIRLQLQAELLNLEHYAEKLIYKKVYVKKGGLDEK